MHRSVTRRQFLGGAAALGAGVALDGCSLAGVLAPTAEPTHGRPTPDPNASLILRNATVLTMDPDRPSAEAVLIVGDTITAVGTSEEVRTAAAADARIVDLGGRVLLPGFNDAHCHRIGDRDVTGQTDDEAIAAALAGGWTSISELFVNQERVDQGNPFLLVALSAASMARPCRQCGHDCCGNQK